MSNPLLHADACHVCGQRSLDEVAGFRTFHRVTSDGRPWPAGGRLHVCTACGCVQKTADETWSREAASIYADYKIYHAAEGAEQAVFSSSGQTMPRSARLVRGLRALVPLPPAGRLLDIGCGNGALLRTFSQAEPQWSLVGTELDSRHRQAVEAIDRVEALCTCSPGETPGLSTSSR